MGTWSARETGCEAIQDLGYFCLLIAISGLSSLLVIPFSFVPVLAWLSFLDVLLCNVK